MKWKTFAFVGVMAMVATALAAQEPTPPPETAPQVEASKTIEGDVVEVSAESLTIRATDGRRLTFTVGRDLTTGSTPVTVGSRVQVEYRGDELFEVVDVHLLGDPGVPEDNGSDNGGVEPSPQTAPAASSKDALPETASPLPLLLVSGLALLGSGLGLSARRRG